ncbi:MAG: hypothetical protein IID61_00280 [SAR324 cluster bacterium]|nr:hypothetical protein [SAR324 cluster bacterium]
MRPENPILTATDQGIESLPIPDAAGDRTGSGVQTKENTVTDGDNIHIESSGFTINVLFSVPEDLPRWLTDLEQQIDHLAWLEQDFDGEGSPAIRMDNMEAAKQLVRRLFTERNMCCAEAFPTSQAGVELELTSKYWEAAIWVNDPTSVEYFVKYGNKKRSGKAPATVVPDKIWESLA